MADFVQAEHSCRAAGHFDVSDSCAIKLVRRTRDVGSPAPDRQGRPPGRGKLVAYESFLIQTVEARPAIAMPELAARLLEQHGVMTAPGLDLPFEGLALPLGHSQTRGPQRPKKRLGNNNAADDGEGGQNKPDPAIERNSILAGHQTLQPSHITDNVGDRRPAANGGCRPPQDDVEPLDERLGDTLGFGSFIFSPVAGPGSAAVKSGAPSLGSTSGADPPCDVLRLLIPGTLPSLVPFTNGFNKSISFLGRVDLRWRCSRCLPRELSLLFGVSCLRHNQQSKGDGNCQNAHE
jgi:hypothetical protein